jgi:hypothetical protein
MVLWFARGIIWRAEVPFFRDLSTYFYPLRFVLWQAFQNRELPLWNRHFAMGFPVLADFESGTFYPPHLLFLSFSVFSAIRFLYVFHYLVSAAGAYVLLRHWRYAHHQAVVAALLFSFGGTMVSLINLLNHFQSAVWFPWVLFSWSRFLQRKTARDFVVLIVVLTTQFLAGSPEIYGFTILVLVVSTFIGVPYNTSMPFRAMLWLSLAHVVIIGLAAVQIFPTIELFLESRRQEPIPMQEALSWSLNPWRLINLFLLDKRVDFSVGDGTQLFLDRDVPLFVTRYLGAVCLLGISFWAIVSSLKEKLVWVSLTVCFLLLAFGSFTPFYPFLYEHFAAFRAFRYPEKFFFVVNAILILGGLRGLSQFEANGFEKSTKALIGATFCFVLLLVSYLILRVEPALLTHFIVRQKGFPLPATMTYTYAASVFVALERQLALCGGLLTIFWAASTRYLQPGLYRFLLVGVVFTDLSWAHEGFQYLLNPDRVLSAANVLSLPEKDPNRIFYYPSGKNLHAGAFVIRRPPSTAFDRIYTTVASNLLPNAGVLLGFDYMQDINALAKNSYVTFLKYANQLDSEKQFRLLGSLNVKYVISFQPIESLGVALVREFPEYPSWLYKIDRVLPRTYIVSRTVTEANPSRILRELANGTSDPEREVFLDAPHAATTGNFGRGEARILNYGNQQVSILADTSTPGVLVLADSFYPGWRAYVDGKEEHILRANYFFRAVDLQAGRHLVEFKYEPYWFRVGAFVSLLSTALLVLFSIVLVVIRFGWIKRETLQFFRPFIPGMAGSPGVGTA